MAGGRPWTATEETYLMEKWGQISIPAIAKNLKRTVYAIKNRASRLHLGPALMPSALNTVAARSGTASKEGFG